MENHLSNQPATNPAGGSWVFARDVLDWSSLPRAAREEVTRICSEGPGTGAGSFLIAASTEGWPVVEIQLAETDRLDWALKQFRRRMLRSGMFRDMRRKRFYEKPSEARKAKAKAAERRRHKDRKRERAASRFGL